LTSISVNTTPTRSKPSDIASEKITAIGVGRVNKLHPLTGKIGLYLRHKEEE